MTSPRPQGPPRRVLPSSDRHLARVREKVAEGEPVTATHAARVLARLDVAETERDQLRAACAAPASDGA